MRSTGTLFSLALLSSVSIMGTAASAAVVAGGNTWEYGYTGDGDLTPQASTTPDFTIGGAPTSESVSGGILTQVSPADGGRYYLTPAGGAWNPTAASGETAFLEARIKIDEIASGARWGTQVFIGANNFRIDLNVGTFGGQYGVFDANLVLLATMDSTTVLDWHTYRVEMNSANGTFNLWVDGLQPIANRPMLGNIYNDLYFGDGSGDAGGTQRIDYVVWNNSGAPVPEPAALSLLGGAALMLVRRRR